MRRIKLRGDFNRVETLIHKIQSKTDNKQARLRWRGILMRLRLKLRQWAASIKACHTAQQLQIRQLSLGFKALAYRHLHTAVSPRVENTASQILSHWVCLRAGNTVCVRLDRWEGQWLSCGTESRSHLGTDSGGGGGGGGGGGTAVRHFILEL